MGIVRANFIMPQDPPDRPGIAEQRARKTHRIRLPEGHDLLGLRGLRDEAHGDGGNARAGPDRLGERHLVARTELHLRVVDIAARRSVDHVDADLLQAPAQHHRLLDVPAALRPVGRRDAIEDRLVLRPRIAHGARDLEGETHAIVERASVCVGALVGDRRDEGMDEVAVCAVDLHHVEARGERVLRALAEILDGAPDLVQRHLLRRRVVAERDRARCERLPAALFPRKRLAAAPRLVDRGLAPGVRDLDRGHGSAGADEFRDRFPRLCVRVGPDPGVPRRNAPLGRDRARFDAHERGAAHGAAAQVHEVPFIGHAVLAGVLAHG